MPPVTGPADRIERFLRDNPSGTLWVAVGFASAFGLSWLNQRTSGRPVRLLIGDTRTGFDKHKDTDRLGAIRFLQRSDVQVRSWYSKRGGYRTAHAKAWSVETDKHLGTPGSVLVGSANLTKQGLFKNFEMLAVAAPSEHENLFVEMRRVFQEGWNVESDLLDKLGHPNQPTPQSPTHPPARGHAPRHTGPSRPRGHHRMATLSRIFKLWRGAAIVVAGVGILLTILFAILAIVMLGELGSPSGPMPSPASPAPPQSAQAVAADQSDIQPSPPPAESPPPISEPQVALTDRPEARTSPPPEGWTPVVDGNASSYGAPERPDLQWVSWQPSCPSCEPGATLTWVGSYAFPYNHGVGLDGWLRPKLQSACLHRERTGPQIDWRQDISEDRVEALWIDGRSKPPGDWWIGSSHGGGSDIYLMVPEPEPFLALLAGAQQLRVLTAEGRDATFSVDGFLETSVQANLDHCGHYP